jgi:hypothetical protein
VVLKVMTLRAEQIVDAMASIIAGYASYTGNVFTNRAESLSEAQGELPATSVDQGSDEPLDEDGATNMAFFDSLLTVETTIVARSTNELDLKATLSDMRRRVQQALMQDQQLGLPFVIGLRYGGADKPEINAESEFMIGKLVCRWPVHYRMNISDPGD